MHVLCLGVDLLVAGNVMTQLVGCEGLWEGHDTDAKLLCAWQRFKTWAKENKWQLPVGTSTLILVVGPFLRILVPLKYLNLGCTCNSL